MCVQVSEVYTALTSVTEISVSTTRLFSLTGRENIACLYVRHYLSVIQVRSTLDWANLNVDSTNLCMYVRMILCRLLVKNVANACAGNFPLWNDYRSHCVLAD